MTCILYSFNTQSMSLTCNAFYYSNLALHVFMLARDPSKMCRLSSSTHCIHCITAQLNPSRYILFLLSRIHDASGVKGFIFFMNRLPLLSLCPPSAPSLMLQGVPCDTEGRCGRPDRVSWSSYFTSLQIKATPGRSCTVELVIWTLWILAACCNTVVPSWTAAVCFLET